MRRIHNSTRSTFAFLLLWLLAFGSLPAMAVGTYYVSPTDGSDVNTGGISDPFLTITKAQTALRAAGGGTVYLRGGTYTLTSTIVFNEQDSNSTYQAYAGEVPIISGGVVLSSWSPYSGDIYQTHVTWNFRGLFKDGVRLNYRNPITYTRTTNGWTINATFTDSPTNPASLLVSGGDWALDKSTGTVYYKTGGGAPTGTLVAPSLGTLFSVAATTQTARVTNLTFDHLYFFYNNWLIPGTDDTTYTDNWIGTFGVSAASCGVTGGCAGEMPGAAMVEFGTNVTFRSCRVAHNESSGIVFGRGVSNSQVVGSEVWDNAGNGIRIGSKGNTGTSPGWIQLPAVDPNGATLTADWYGNANWVESSNVATDNYAHDNGVLIPTAANINISDLSGPQASYNRTDNTEFDSIVGDIYWSSFHGDYNHIAHSNISPWVGDGAGLYTASGQASPNVGFPGTLTGNLAHSTNGFGPLYTDQSNDQYTVSNNVTYNVGFNTSPPTGISYIVFNNYNNITTSSCCNNSTPTAANINSAVASTGPRSPYTADLFSGDQTVTFIDQPNNIALTGVNDGIDWGSQLWSTAINQGIHYVWVNSGTTAPISQTFTLPAGKVLKGISTFGCGTVAVSSAGNTTQTYNLGAWTAQTTGWATAAPLVTLTITAPCQAWSDGVTNFVYGDPSGGDTTVTFMDRPSNAPLAGLYNNVNWGFINQQLPAGWGSQVWYTGSNGAHYAFINSSSTSAVAQNITLPPGKVLKSFLATATGTASITVSANGNSTRTFTPTASWTTFTTGWTGSPTFTTGYTAGAEDVTIQMTGSNGASSVHLTNIVYGSASTSTRVDDGGTGASYTGTGWQTFADSNCYLGNQHFTNIANDYAQFTFTGTSVDFGYTTASNRGKADIYIDGVFQQTVDFYSAATVYQVILYSKTGLSSGSHTLKIVNNGTKNASSTDYYIGVDFFDYQ